MTIPVSMGMTSSDPDAETGKHEDTKTKQSTQTQKMGTAPQIGMAVQFAPAAIDSMGLCVPVDDTISWDGATSDPAAMSLSDPYASRATELAA